MNIRTQRSYKLLSSFVAITAVVAIFGLMGLQPQKALSAGNSAPMSGYAWSDTIGWIDLNCLNANVCASNPFGFSVASDGTLSGYAWSDNIGWVSANASDVAGCPSGTCTPKLQNGTMSGWIRALAGSTAQSGGWNGFISLAGSGYGVTKGSGAALSGYAWGDTNVGWVDFSRAALVASCVPTYSCVGNTYTYQDAYCASSTVKVCIASCTPGGCSEDITPPVATIKALPLLVQFGGTTKISWTSTGATSCTVTGNGDSWSGLSSAGNTTKPINDTVTYTLACTNNGGTTQQTVKVSILPHWQEQ